MSGRYGSPSPRRRGPYDPWFRVGTVDVDTTTLVTALGVLSMFVYAADKTLLEHLVLWPSKILEGQVWRLASWPLVNVPSLGAIIALAFFWYFGRELERVMARNRFALFLAIVAVVPAVLATAFDWRVTLQNGGVGIDLIEISVFVCFVVRHPTARFFFNIPAWVFGAVIVGVRVLELTGDRLYDELWVFFSTLGVALLLLRAWGFADEATWIPKLPWPSRRGGARPFSSGGGPARGDTRRGAGRRGLRRGKKSQPDLRVVAPPPSAPIPRIPAEIDAILDKIAAQGIESLTPDERRQLDQASKRLREERG